jgi:hypothetical protein
MDSYEFMVRVPGRYSAQSQRPGPPLWSARLEGKISKISPTVDFSPYFSLWGSFSGAALAMHADTIPANIDSSYRIEPRVPLVPAELWAFLVSGGRFKRAFWFDPVTGLVRSRHRLSIFWTP